MLTKNIKILIPKIKTFYEDRALTNEKDWPDPGGVQKVVRNYDSFSRCDWLGLYDA